MKLRNNYFIVNHLGISSKKFPFAFLAGLIDRNGIYSKYQYSIKFFFVFSRRFFKNFNNFLFRHLGINFFIITENYFASVLLLVIIKLGLSFCGFRLIISLNYLLLLLILLGSIKINLMVKIRDKIKGFLDLTLPFFVIYEELEGIHPQTLEITEKEDKYKNLFHDFIIKVIFFRLFLEQEKILFFIFNFIILQIFLFNKLIILLGFYQLIMLISKLLLYINDYNMQNLKASLVYYDKELKNNELTIKATKNNSLLLSYHIFRELQQHSIFRTPKKNQTLNIEFLEIKITEKFVFKINHKFINSNHQFDKYKPKITINNFLGLKKGNNINKPFSRTFVTLTKENRIYFVSSNVIIEYIKKNFPNAVDLKMIKNMAKHPAAVKIDIDENTAEIVIGTSHYPKTPTRNMYVWDKVTSKDLVFGIKAKQGALQAANSEGLQIPLSAELIEILTNNEIIDANLEEIQSLKSAFQNFDFFEGVQNQGLGYSKVQNLNNFSNAQKTALDELLQIRYNINTPIFERIGNDKFIDLNWQNKKNNNRFKKFSKEEILSDLRLKEQNTNNHQISHFFKIAIKFEQAKQKEHFNNILYLPPPSSSNENDDSN